MLGRVMGHIRGSAVAYVALFVALGGTSYAAVRLTPGSVTTKALAKGAVTNSKLAHNSVGTNNLRQHSLVAADFKPGALAIKGSGGSNGSAGATGPAGPAGPAGKDGSASVVMTAHGTGNVTAPHGASTSVPLTGNTWTQGANDLNLVTGSMDVGVPASCTGSFGNALVVSVDGVPNTFGVAPSSPASSTVPVPFQVSELMEPGASKQHTLTAAVTNSCTKSGEDFTISNVKIDVVNFH